MECENLQIRKSIRPTIHWTKNSTQLSVTVISLFTRSLFWPGLICNLRPINEKATVHNRWRRFAVETSRNLFKLACEKMTSTAATSTPKKGAVWHGGYRWRPIDKRIIVKFEYRPAPRVQTDNDDQYTQHIHYDTDTGLQEYKHSRAYNFFTSARSLKSNIL